jgi:tripartite-type tricarboxylate transporter receptor subunit TctC
VDVASARPWLTRARRFLFPGLQSADDKEGHAMATLGRRNRNRILGAMLVLALSAVTAAAAEEYPGRPITIVSPYPPGGTTDILARMLAPKLQEALKQPIIVENKGGASSNIGTEFVAKSKPDGYTLLLGNNTGVVINPHLYKLNIDPARDLAPVIEVAAVPLVLYVHPSIPANSVGELIDLVQKNPGKYEFASGGSGSPQHLSGELLKLMRGLDMIHIPYKGQGPAMTDVVAGHVPIAFETTVVLLPFIESKRVRSLATTGATRSVTLPDVPTMIEAGLPGFEITNWYGVFAPAGTPLPILERLNNELRKILLDPDIRERLAKMGSAIVHGSRDDFSAFIKVEGPRWADLVKKSGARID